MPWQPDICIHHFPCDDGFGAAWAVNRKWPGAVEFRPSNYGQPVPDQGIEGKNILIADFSFKPDVLRAIADRAKSVIILDHHKTAAADLAEVDSFGGDHVHAGHLFSHMGTANVLAWFDMEKSGARLAWEFCFGFDEPPPLLVCYLEDRDLWRMAYPETRAFSLFLRSWPFDFDTWTNIAEWLDQDRDGIIAEARSIERFYNLKIVEICKTATIKTIGLHNDVPVANAPWAFASDVANELLKRFPDAPLAATYFDSYGARSYSLRSEDSRADASELARAFGGGGHRNAAGFRVPL